MGGEINIQDKEHGARGTCFRFNIFLKSCQTIFSSVDGEQKSLIQSNLQAQSFSEPIKLHGIQSLILIDGDETRKILQRWMENIGIKVWLVHSWQLLYSTLEKIKFVDNGSGKFDTILHEHIGKDISSSSNNEIDQILPLTTKEVYKKQFRDSSAAIMIVIDISSGNFLDICSILDNFSKANQKKIIFKVVWFVNPNTQSSELTRLKQKSCDLILKKPIHGSRLYEILRLLQDLARRNEGRLTINRSQDITINRSQDISYDIQPSNKENLLTFNSDKPLNGMKLLLVDDTLLMRRIASAILLRLGATVESAENGLEALNLVKKAFEGENPDYDENNKAQGVLRYFPYEIVLMDCEVIKCFEFFFLLVYSINYILISYLLQLYNG